MAKAAVACTVEGPFGEAVLIDVHFKDTRRGARDGGFDEKRSRGDGRVSFKFEANGRVLARRDGDGFFRTSRREC